MIRFIDLRGQIYLDDEDPKEKQEPIFAFYDTTVDQFVGWDQYYIWGSRTGFATDFWYYAGWRGIELERFLNLMHGWVPAEASKNG